MQMPLMSCAWANTAQERPELRVPSDLHVPSDSSDETGLLLGSLLSRLRVAGVCQRGCFECSVCFYYVRNGNVLHIRWNADIPKHVKSEEWGPFGFFACLRLRPSFAFAALQWASVALPGSLPAMLPIIASGYTTMAQEHNVLDLFTGGTSGTGSFGRRSARASSLAPKGSRHHSPRHASLGNDDANDSPIAWATPQDEQHAEAEACYERHSWACNKNARGEGFTHLGHATEQIIRGKTGAVGKGLPCGEEEDDWGGHAPPGGTSPRPAVAGAGQGCISTRDGGSKESPSSPYRRLFPAGIFRKKPAVEQQAACAMVSELQNANGCAPALAAPGCAQTRSNAPNIVNIGALRALDQASGGGRSGAGKTQQPDLDDGNRYARREKAERIKKQDSFKQRYVCLDVSSHASFPRALSLSTRRSLFTAIYAPACYVIM
jgi:hypothetical protein